MEQVAVVSLSDRTKALVESYRRVFSLPSCKVLSLLLVLVSSLHLLLVALTSPGELIRKSIWYSASVGVNFALMLTPREKRVLNLKRALGLALLIGAGVLAGRTLALLLLPLGIFVCVCISGLVFVSWLALLDVALPLLGLACFVETLSVQFAALTTRDLLDAIISSFAAATLLCCYFYALSRYTRGKLGLSLLDVIRGYAFLQLSRRRERIERVMEAVSSRGVVPLALVEFRRGRRPVLSLVISGVHFGPISVCGSSDLPYTASRLIFEARGSPVLVLRAYGSHDFDLPSLSEQMRVLRGLSSLVSELSAKRGSSRISLLSLSQRDFRVLRLDLPGLSLLMVTRAPKTTDDVDTGLGVVVEELSRRFGVRSLIVDAHNSLDDSIPVVDASCPEFRDLARVVVSALESHADVTGYVRLGFAIASPLLPEVIGPLGIGVIALEVGGVRVGLVIIDTNNLSPSLYSSLRSSLRSLFDIVEVVTTDTHLLCATRPRVAQVLLGPEHKIENLILTLARAALASMREVEVVAGMTHVSTRVLGRRGVSLLESLAVLGSMSLVRELMLVVMISGLLALLI